MPNTPLGRALVDDFNAATQTELADSLALRLLTQVAELIDQGEDGDCYTQSAKLMQRLIDDPSATPSARLLNELEQAQCSFFEFAMAVARQHRDYFASIEPLSAERSAEFTREARDSLARQYEIETTDSISLDEYLAQYFGTD